MEKIITFLIDLIAYEVMTQNICTRNWNFDYNTSEYTLKLCYYICTNYIIVCLQHTKQKYQVQKVIEKQAH